MKYSFKRNSPGQEIALDVCKARNYGALYPCRRCMYYKKKRFCPELRDKARREKESLAE